MGRHEPDLQRKLMEENPYWTCIPHIVSGQSPLWFHSANWIRFIRYPQLSVYIYIICIYIYTNTYIYICTYLYISSCFPIYGTYNIITYIFEGSLEVKLPTIWADEAEEVGRVGEEKKIKVCEKVEKSRNNVSFQCFVALTYASWDAQEVDAVVARSTLRSANAKSASASEHLF